MPFVLKNLKYFYQIVKLLTQDAIQYFRGYPGGLLQELEFTFLAWRFTSNSDLNSSSQVIIAVITGAVNPLMM